MLSRAVWKERVRVQVWDLIWRKSGNLVSNIYVYVCTMYLPIMLHITNGIETLFLYSFLIRQVWINLLAMADKRTGSLVLKCIIHRRPFLVTVSDFLLQESATTTLIILGKLGYFLAIGIRFIVPIGMSNEYGNQGMLKKLPRYVLLCILLISVFVKKQDLFKRLNSVFDTLLCYA